MLLPFVWRSHESRTLMEHHTATTCERIAKKRIQYLYSNKIMEMLKSKKKRNYEIKEELYLKN